MENNVKYIVIFFKKKGRINDCMLVKILNKFSLEDFVSVFSMSAIYVEIDKNYGVYKKKYQILHKLLPIHTFRVCKQLRLNFLAFSTKQLYRKLLKQNISSIYL